MQTTSGENPTPPVPPGGALERALAGVDAQRLPTVVELFRDAAYTEPRVVTQSV